MFLERSLDSWGRKFMFAAAFLLGLGPLVRAADSEGERIFATVVLPTLESRCYECHAETADRVKGGLLLDRAAGLLQGGESGAAVIPEQPRTSLLIRAIRHDGIEMPPKGEPLEESTISQFERWIELGAPDPRNQPMIELPSGIDFEAGRRHWAFQAIRHEARDETGQRLECSVDRFVERRLREEGLDFAEEAPRRDLARRLSFDLLGLPPTHDEIDAFVNDDSPGAYRALVDRLLSSPHFGEKQSQMWLDVVRFAESEGFEYDRHLPDAWRYRDYVINAFNADKPFDQFVTEQIAGDEFDSPTEETLAAAVFHRLGAVRRNAGNPDIALSRNEVLTERTDVIGAAILGLTVGCARCHDHKFDPISQRDYYQLQAYLAATAEDNVALEDPERVADWEAMTEELDKKLKVLNRQFSRAKREDQPAIKAEIAALEAQRPPPIPKIPTIRNDFEKVTKMHVLKRGVWERKGDPVGMKPLDVFVGRSFPEHSPSGPKPRTELAAWLTGGQQTLTARVIVNRVWQNYFGVGLVPTANDFGLNGGKPSHPQLLDFLASELIRHEWRLKPIHRMIVLSRTYRQSARVEASPIAAKVDPDNRLMWRHNPRRLTGEELRDSMLAASGVLNDRMLGTSVLLPVEEDLVKLLYKPEQWQVSADVSEHDRRSVYLIAKRNLRLPFMEVFDQPALLTSCYRRESSTHAPQALELLNGVISNDLARRFAERLRQGGDRDKLALVDACYRLALGRQANEPERTLAAAYLANGSLVELALAMFNLNEFSYVF